MAFTFAGPAKASASGNVSGFGDRKQERKIKTFTTDIAQADKVYDKWSKRYKTEKLHQYYLGHQRDVYADPTYQKYVANLFFSSIESRRPSLVFNRPKIHVTARPNRSDDAASNVDARAKLYEDTGNTFFSDPTLGLVDALHLATHSAFFSFGCIEVGYSADLIDNPDAEKPMLDDDDNEVFDEEGDAVDAPAQLIKEENVYFKWIPSDTVRISISGKNETERNDWVGYYEYVALEDIRANSTYDKRAVAELKAQGRIKSEYRDKPRLTDTTRDERNDNLIKLWKRWDLRSKKLYLFCEDSKRFLAVREFRYLPLSFLRFHPILKEWYPLPPTFNWLSPQDNYNDERDSQRIHRRRAKRRYLYLDGKIDEDELAKLESDEDFVYAKTTQLDALKPVEDAPLDRAFYAGLGITKDDFSQVSSIGGEQRAVADSKTATQANIISTESQTREAWSRSQVAKFVADIASILLKTLRDDMALEFWVLTNVDIHSEGAQVEAQHVAETWKQITSDDLDYNFHWEVAIDVESMMSPVTDDRMRADWTNMLSTITNPAVAPILMASPALLRKTMKLIGITDEKDIVEIRQAFGVLALQQQQQQLAADAGVPAGGGAPPAGAPATGGARGPDMSAIMQSLGAQMGGSGGVN